MADNNFNNDNINNNENTSNNDDILNIAARIRGGLSEHKGRAILILGETPSTMDAARENAARLGDRAVVVARSQTGGKGRLYGRAFFSPEGGLYMTLLLAGTPDPLLTAAAGVSAAEAIRARGVNAEIKWVNDVMCGYRKLCGILAQSYLAGGGLKPFAAVGIGINVARQAFPPPLDQIAASVDEFAPEPVDIAVLAADLLNRLDFLLSPEGRGDIIARYREYSCLLGRGVWFEEGGKVVSGVATNIGDDGSLAVELEGGGVRRLMAGEVSVRQSELMPPP